MRLLRYLWNYIRLSRKVNSLYNLYITNETIDTEEGHLLLDIIHNEVLNCGAICIKFCQWLIPVLDNIYIKGNDKPYWFTSLERLYENCPVHSNEYTKQIYEDEFNENFDDDYTLVDVIGSGSVGQVYKIKNKHDGKDYAFKVIHPDVRYELTIFRKMMNLFLWVPCIRNKMYTLVPVDYKQFLNNFEEQIDMIRESNNLLRMNYNYRNNKHIIIPQLIRCSPSCMIMTYEEGDIMDQMELSGYQRTKIISLLYGFISSNQLFYDIMHNDIHKANWKIRKLNEDRYSMVVYDFGYCYHKRVKDRPMVQLMTDLCESADEKTDNRDNCVQMVQFFIDDYTEPVKELIKEIIPDVFKADPNHIFDLTIAACRGTNSVVDAGAFQALITSIQCYKYLKEAGINNGHNLKNDGYRMYRERYMDLINLYTTYDCFHEFVEYMNNKLDTLDIEVTGLFDTIKDNETITSELTKLLKFTKK